MFLLDIFSNRLQLMILKKGDKIYYLEYLDHGRTPDNIEKLKENPLILWSCGYIVNENDENEDYYALISTGSRFRNVKPRMYNYILKKCITKKLVVHIVKDEEK